MKGLIACTALLVHPLSKCHQQYWFRGYIVHGLNDGARDNAGIAQMFEEQPCTEDLTKGLRAAELHAPAPNLMVAELLDQLLVHLRDGYVFTVRKVNKMFRGPNMTANSADAVLHLAQRFGKTLK
jgi:hypothetical protein